MRRKDFREISSEFAAEITPAEYCGTKIYSDPSEADQVPFDDNVTMSAFPEGYARYPCVTQDGFKPTFGEPPQDEAPADGEEDFAPVMVGVGNIIPRWAVSKANPTKLLYFVVKKGFSDKISSTHPGLPRL